MQRYAYSGKSADGTLVQGRMAANDLSDLESKLLDRGVYLESSRPAFDNFRQHLIRLLRATEITRTTHQLQILLASRVSVLEALELVHDQIRDRSLYAIFQGVIKEVEAGRALADALRDYPIIFDELYTGMVEAGEMSGRLDFSFDRIAGYREKTEATVRKLKSALAYPMLVIVVAVCVVLALMLYVVPVFSSMYENFNAELPAMTRTVVAVSGTLRENVWYIAGGLLLLLFATFSTAMTRRFRLLLDTTLLRAPLLSGLMVRLVSARFCRTMGALLTGGVDILYALNVAAKTTSNMHAASRLGSAASLLVEGKSLTEALTATGIFPKTVLRLAASGEKTGQLGEMLSRAADFYESETDTAITTLTALIEPTIIIILGGVVAFILVAMYLPLFELVRTV